MPGRPKTTVRKVSELEGDVLALHQRIDAAVPATHKAIGNGGSSASETPWALFYQAGCGLVVAAVALGEHYRRAAGIEQAGPIRETLGDDALGRIRQYAVSRCHVVEGTQPLHQSEWTHVQGLPDRATIQSEIEWVGANLHVPSPAFDKAPSRMAVSLLLDAKSDERVRREFWSILLGKRLGTGDPTPKAAPFQEGDISATLADEHDAELIRQMKERLGEISG
ncbi:MAG: hypothetical protein HY287_15895 [Planctomycetes bacterium]|nr:hypothetical protein [Planctomycetota bacterium]MBI3835809.1 hypothetical protein [Planctomycetota bacterium]